jgi:copper chaperone
LDLSIPTRGITQKEEIVTTTTEYQVTGMTCGHCEMSVREEVGQIAGVEEIQVSAKTGKLVVTAAQSLDDADVLSAVDEAGYSAVRI